MSKTFNEQVYVTTKDDSVPVLIATTKHYRIPIAFKPGPDIPFRSYQAIFDPGANVSAMISTKVLSDLDPSSDKILGTTRAMTFHGCADTEFLVVNACFRVGDKIFMDEPVIVVPGLFADVVVGTAITKQFTTTLKPDGTVHIHPHNKTIGPLLGVDREQIQLKPDLRSKR